MVEQISVHELKEMLERGEKICLLDVRSPEEYAVANLGGTLIPLQELQRRYGELPRDVEIIVHCHHGMRSYHAALFLLSKGLTNVKNLAGGIDQWSVKIDPAVPRY